MEQQRNNDEIDLSFIFTKIGDLWRSFLVWIYNCIQFALKNWIALLLLVIVGIGLGYLWQENSLPNKKTTLIIQTNFGSTHYVYNAAEKIKKTERDPYAADKYGFDNDNPIIEEVTLTPIIDLISLTADIRDPDRIFEELIARADFEDEILLSEIFFEKYKYHRLEIITKGTAKSDVIDSVLAYLNDSEVYSVAKPIGIEETKAQILSLEKSVEGIDAVFFSFKKDETDDLGPQYVFNNTQSTNFHLLLNEKAVILKQIEALKLDLLRMDDTVSVINNPKLYFDRTILDQKTTLVPLLFIVVFILIKFTVRFYKKMQANQPKQ
ncbi:hypothetical protein SCB49_06112 [unidentified eubacterium SCB49]|nr:hypothetical protein SCB49_06112 [unidentified eubacterium SCB49]